MFQLRALILPWNRKENIRKAQWVEWRSMDSPLCGITKVSKHAMWNNKCDVSPSSTMEYLGTLLAVSAPGTYPSLESKRKNSKGQMGRMAQYG